MLVRFSCDLCEVSGVWTDCPSVLLNAVCRSKRSCRAAIVGEGAVSRIVEPHRSRRWSPAGAVAPAKEARRGRSLG